MQLFWLALSFLTTIPAKQIPYIPGGLGKSAAFFSLIGLLIGSIVFGVAWVTSLVLPLPLVAGFALLAWVLLTGGLHLDGLADCCDGLLGAAPAEKRLEILKDPRSGAFGVIGLIIGLGLKGVALYAILHNGGVVENWLPLLFAPTFARFLILPTALQPQARPGGMGSDFASTISKTVIGFALIIPTLLFLWGLGQPVQLIAAVVLSILGAAWWIYLAKSRINGVTGDVYGAVVETAEILVLIGFTVIV